MGVKAAHKYVDEIDPWLRTTGLSNLVKLIFLFKKQYLKLILYFRVGGDSKIQYLVLQVHYAHLDMIQESGDDSGNTNDTIVLNNYKRILGWHNITCKQMVN